MLHGDAGGSASQLKMEDNVAVAFVLDLPLTPAQAQALFDEVDPTRNPNAGQIFHAQGPYGEGTRVMDVWESPEAFGAFAESRLGPAVQKLGLTVEIPPPDFFP